MSVDGTINILVYITWVIDAWMLVGHGGTLPTVKPQYSKKTPFQCHFYHQKFPQWLAGNWTLTSTMINQPLSVSAMALVDSSVCLSAGNDSYRQPCSVCTVLLLRLFSPSLEGRGRLYTSTYLTSEACKMNADSPSSRINITDTKPQIIP